MRYLALCCLLLSALGSDAETMPSYKIVDGKLGRP